MSKKFFVFGFVLILSFHVSFAQISGIINSYASVSALSGNVITIANLSLAPTDATINNAFGVGKKVLIIQMKGASVNTTNTASFGSVTNLNQAGNYEIATITNLVNSPPYAITVSNLNRSYDVNGALQIVSFPQYTDITINGTVTATAWSRTLGRGGIVAFEVSNILTMNGSVDVSNLGFAGGLPNTINQASCNNFTTYVSTDLDATFSQRHAQKGEGIADFNFNGIAGQEYARGAMANGGGGGNSHNGGGGGGSNFSIGGNGGYGWLGTTACSGSVNQANGIGGYVLDYSPANNKIFMGGGGGAGQQNNSLASRGGNGGGIILIRAKQVQNTCGSTWGFYANGEKAPNSGGNDGGGGGAAGGTILLEIYNFVLSCNLNISTNGGIGGTVNNGGIHGGGGGGSKGAILFLNNPPTQVQIINNIGTPGLDCNGACTATGLSGGTTATQYQTGWIVTGDVVSLPIRLVSFSAEVVNKEVKISWITATEQNTAYFEIEKSKDLQKIEVIGKLDATGFSEQLKSYQLFDESPYQGINYYRLKSVDFDGTFAYSQWISLKNGNEFLVKIFPNPVSAYLFLKDEMDKPQSKKMILYNLKGEIVFQKTFLDQLEIPVKNFVSGVYILKIVGQTEVLSRKIVIQSQ